MVHIPTDDVESTFWTFAKTALVSLPKALPGLHPVSIDPRVVEEVVFDMFEELEVSDDGKTFIGGWKKMAFLKHDLISKFESESPVMNKAFRAMSDHLNNFYTMLSSYAGEKGFPLWAGEMFNELAKMSRHAFWIEELARALGVPNPIRPGIRPGPVRASAALSVVFGSLWRDVRLEGHDPVDELPAIDLHMAYDLSQGKSSAMNANLCSLLIDP